MYAVHNGNHLLPNTIAETEDEAVQLYLGRYYDYLPAGYEVIQCETN